DEGIDQDMHPTDLDSEGIVGVMGNFHKAGFYGYITNLQNLPQAEQDSQEKGAEGELFQLRVQQCRLSVFHDPFQMQQKRNKGNDVEQIFYAFEGKGRIQDHEGEGQ